MGIEGVPDFKIIKEQELMEHFRIIYRNNEKFGKKILEDTAKARDTLRVFMVHWLAGIMVSGGHITRDVAIDVQRSLGVLKR